MYRSLPPHFWRKLCRFWNRRWVPIYIRDFKRDIILKRRKTEGCRMLAPNPFIQERMKTEKTRQEKNRQMHNAEGLVDPSARAATCTRQTSHFLFTTCHSMRARRSSLGAARPAARCCAAHGATPLCEEGDTRRRLGTPRDT